MGVRECIAFLLNWQHEMFFQHMRVQSRMSPVLLCLKGEREPDFAFPYVGTGSVLWPPECLPPPPPPPPRAILLARSRAMPLGILSTTLCLKLL